MDGDGWKRMAWVVSEVERVRLGRDDMEMIGFRKPAELVFNVKTSVIADPVHGGVSVRFLAVPLFLGMRLGAP
ncbi:unnamed protein product [Boreogadus saida]